MNYKNQLSLVIGLISLRILTLLPYVSLQPIMPWSYTPYIVLLYSLFDILILCYLYHFVKGIKKQNFSLIALVLIILSLIYEHALGYFLVSDNNWSTFQLQMIYMPASSIHIISMIIISVQLIRNKATDSSKQHMVHLGWSYIIVFILGVVFPLANIFIELFPDSSFYTLNMIRTVPLIAMILLYLNEWKLKSNTNDYIGGPTVDSEI